MRVILLKDLDEGCADGVIVAHETTTEELQEIITELRNKEDFQWEDLLKGLPKDCTIYDRWNNLEVVYY